MGRAEKTGSSWGGAAQYSRGTEQWSGKKAGGRGARRLKKTSDTSLVPSEKNVGTGFLFCVTLKFTLSSLVLFHHLNF